jgi:hypothetical protein
VNHYTVNYLKMQSLYKCTLCQYETHIKRRFIKTECCNEICCKRCFLKRKSIKCFNCEDDIIFTPIKVNNYLWYVGVVNCIHIFLGITVLVSEFVTSNIVCEKTLECKLIKAANTSTYLFYVGILCCLIVSKLGYNNFINYSWLDTVHLIFGVVYIAAIKIINENILFTILAPVLFIVSFIGCVISLIKISEYLHNIGELAYAEKTMREIAKELQLNIDLFIN